MTTHNKSKFSSLKLGSQHLAWILLDQQLNSASTLSMAVQGLGSVVAWLSRSDGLAQQFLSSSADWRPGSATPWYINRLAAQLSSSLMDWRISSPAPQQLSSLADQLCSGLVHQQLRSLADQFLGDSAFQRLSSSSVQLLGGSAP